MIEVHHMSRLSPPQRNVRFKVSHSSFILIPRRPIASSSSAEGGKSNDAQIMPETTRALLMRSLLARYSDLKARLSRTLGPDVASDALAETWLKLESRSEIGPVGNPDAYLYRAALNTGRNLRTANSRLLTFMDVEVLLAVADDAPGPAIIAKDRADIALVEKALAELSDRQRVIFHETFLGDASHHVLAERYGVTVRTIQKELLRAVEHCARRLGKKRSFASGQFRLSAKSGKGRT